MRKTSLNFGIGDVIVCQYDKATTQLTFKRLNSGTTIVLQVDVRPGEELCPCVNLCFKNERVEIVETPWTEMR
jgi:hypothetical protein